MDTQTILQALDQEIARLLQVRRLLAGYEGSSASSKAAAAPVRKKGTMSVEGRARVAAAQRARWAKLKHK